MKINKAVFLFGIVLSFAIDLNSIFHPIHRALSAAPPEAWQTSSDTPALQNSPSAIQAQSVLSTTLSFVGQFTTTYVLDINIIDHFAYLPGWQDASIQIVDISNPAKPTRIGEYETNGIVGGMYIDENIAYVADRNSLLILDVSNPISPSLVTSDTQITNPFIYNVHVADDIAFVANGYESGRTYLFDVTDPGHPILIASRWPNFGTMNVVGRTAFLTFAGNDTGGLMIWDITDPKNINTIGSYQTYYASGGALKVSGPLAGFGFDFSDKVENYYTLTLLDVNTPSQPWLFRQYWEKIDAIDATGRIFVIGMQDQTTFTGRIQLLEVINQDDTPILDSIDIPWRINRIKVKGNLVYVAAGDGGLLIYRINFPYMLYFPILK